MSGGILMTRITKAAIAWSAVCMILLIVGLIYNDTRPWYDQGDQGTIVGQVIGTWIVGLVVIAFIWFVTRGAPARSAEPSGSVPVAPPAPVASTPPKGWYDDAERPGRKRWWDGTAWGITDDEHSSVASGTPRADAEGANGVPVVPGSPEQELAAEHADDAEIAVTPAGSTPETPQEPVVTATAIAADAESASASDAPAAPEEDPAPTPARFCENCGAERRPGSRFCSNCGHAH